MSDLLAVAAEVIAFAASLAAVAGFAYSRGQYQSAKQAALAAVHAKLQTGEAAASQTQNENTADRRAVPRYHDLRSRGARCSSTHRTASSSRWSSLGARRAGDLTRSATTASRSAVVSGYRSRTRERMKPVTAADPARTGTTAPTSDQLTRRV